jgi:hypothetical protein
MKTRFTHYVLKDKALEIDLTNKGYKYQRILTAT